jgi:YesN/AraC family two-component response regulator
VRSLTTNAYDLFITDIRMPDNETLSFLQACQNGVSSVPVIVITGYPSIRTAVEAVRLSVVDYLVKPINDAALRSSVNLAIGKGRVLRSLRRTREEMHIWSEAMDRLEQSLVASESADARTKGAWPVEHVLRQTMVLFSQVVAGLKATLETAKRESPSQRNPDVCMLVQCSKGAVYEEALRRSVEVLMNTKRSFKSKELGDLRKTLVGVLEREARR